MTPFTPEEPRLDGPPDGRAGDACGVKPHIRASDGAVQPLGDHLTQVSEIAERVGRKIGLGLFAKIVGLTHDIGKYSDRFQDYIQSAGGLVDVYSAEEIAELRGQIDHSTFGAKLLWDDACDLPIARLVRQIMALAAASHHSCATDCIAPDGVDHFSTRMRKDLDPIEDHEEWLTIRGEVEKILSSDEFSAQVMAMIAKMKDERDSPVTLHFKFGLLVRLLTSILMDADRVDTADFTVPYMAKARNNGAYPAWADLIEQFEEKLKGFDSGTLIDAIRCDISGICLEESARPVGIYQLTVPTGGGKTLSAVRFALHHVRKHGLDRIVYVAPFISIVDQSADSIRRMFEDKAVVLEHHSNLADQSSEHRLLTENWDSPIVCTTVSNGTQF